MSSFENNLLGGIKNNISGITDSVITGNGHRKPATRTGKDNQGITNFISQISTANGLYKPNLFEITFTDKSSKEKNSVSLLCHNTTTPGYNLETSRAIIYSLGYEVPTGINFEPIYCTAYIDNTFSVPAFLQKQTNKRINQGSWSPKYRDPSTLMTVTIKAFIPMSDATYKTLRNKYANDINSGNSTPGSSMFKDIASATTNSFNNLISTAKNDVSNVQSAVMGYFGQTQNSNGGSTQSSGSDPTSDGLAVIAEYTLENVFISRVMQTGLDWASHDAFGKIEFYLSYEWFTSKFDGTPMPFVPAPNTTVPLNFSTLLTKYPVLGTVYNAATRTIGQSSLMSNPIINQAFNIL